MHVQPTVTIDSNLRALRTRGTAALRALAWVLIKNRGINLDSQLNQIPGGGNRRSGLRCANPKMFSNVEHEITGSASAGSRRPGSRPILRGISPTPGRDSITGENIKYTPFSF